MSKRQLVSLEVLLLLAGAGSCADPNRVPVAGSYYTTFSEDGDPQLGFADPQQGPTTLSFATATGVAGPYLAIVADSCYLYTVAAATATAARRTRLGPFTEAGCQEKIRQLTGDSLHLKRIDL